MEGRVKENLYGSSVASPGKEGFESEKRTIQNFYTFLEKERDNVQAHPHHIFEGKLAHQKHYETKFSPKWRICDTRNAPPETECERHKVQGQEKEVAEKVYFS